MSEIILLTITMLVSDRQDTIEKCMKSLVHLRETVPSELIIVDTAGNQACMDIVRQYTDQIVRFEWCSDFAAARNAGLSRAKGQWFMFLDDDEWFENTDEIEEFFLSGEYRRYNTATYIQRNYTNIRGTEWHDFTALRLIKRGKKTQFVGKIHEIPAPAVPPTRHLMDYVHHYGYAFKTVEEKNQHAWRNIRPLLEMHREQPGNLHVIAQLIQEYIAVGECFSAIELCKKVTRAPNCWKPKFGQSTRNVNYAAMSELRVYMRQQRFGDGYQAGKELLAQKDVTVLAKGILYNQMADICNRLEKYDETLEYIGKYEEQYPIWEKYPDKVGQDAFSACSLFMEPEQLRRLRLLRLHIHVLQEDWMEAGKDLLAVDWELKQGKILSETPQDLISVLKNNAFHEPYMSALKALMSTTSNQKKVYQAVGDNLNSDEGNVLLEYFHLLPPEDSKLCEYHLIYAADHNDLDAAIPALEKMQEANFPFFLQSSAYWEALLKLNININSYMTSLSTYEWMETAKRLWPLIPLEVCETAYACLARGLEKGELRNIFLSSLMIEKRLLAAAEVEGEEIDPESALQMPLTPAEVWDKLNLLSQHWVSCAASLYRENVFLSDLIETIPPAYQFGWYIMQANAVKGQDLGLFRIKVADAAKVYPTLKEQCKTVITGYK